MNVIENEVRELIEKELAAANERFPEFSSKYEGYAIMLEELDRMRDKMHCCESYLENVWKDIKYGGNAYGQAEALYSEAVGGAYQMIELAAVALTFLQMQQITIRLDKPTFGRQEPWRDK